MVNGHKLEGLFDVLLVGPTHFNNSVGARRVVGAWRYQIFYCQSSLILWPTNSISRLKDVWPVKEARHRRGYWILFMRTLALAMLVGWWAIVGRTFLNTITDGIFMGLALAILGYSLKNAAPHTDTGGAKEPVEASNKIDRVCPSCGYENPSYVENFCIKCGSQLEQRDATQFDVHSQTETRAPTTASLLSRVPSDKTRIYSEIKRPLGITIICVLWFLGGVYNLFVGLDALRSNIMLMSQPPHIADPSLRDFLSWAVPIETVVNAVVAAIGIMQFATIYGFLRRKTWSYGSGIAIPIALVITNWSTFILHFLSSYVVDVVPHAIGPFFSIVLAVIYVAYLKQSRVKEYLRV